MELAKSLSSEMGIPLGDSKQKYVSSERITYTIVRPGWLTNDSEDQGSTSLEQGDSA